MNSHHHESYLTLLSTIEAVVQPHAQRPLGSFNKVVASWFSEARKASVGEAEETLKDIRILLMIKAALDGRQWASSRLAADNKPMFEAEWHAQSIGQRLTSAPGLTAAAVRREIDILEALTDETLEQLYRGLAHRLGVVAPQIMPVGSVVEFVPID